MFASALYKKLQQIWQRGLLPYNKALHNPLLSIEECQQLRQLANTYTLPAFSTDKLLNQSLLGEVESFYFGQGLEFEENRLYAPGDDPRFINWRLLAKTGQLYSKVFRETRRPQVFCLVDQRAGMRFGTRQQLKVTLAARFAIFNIYKALTLQFAVGGALIANDIDWFNQLTSETLAHPLIQGLSRSCPPQPFNLRQATLYEALQQTSLQLGAGSIVILISDFHDLSKECETPLYQLSCQHTVMACQIQDPVEQQLPTHDLTLWDETTSQPFTLNVSDKKTQQAYANALTEQQQKINQRMRQANVAMTTVTTAQNFENLLVKQLHEH